MKLERINQILQMPLIRALCLLIFAFLLLPGQLSSGSFLCENKPLSLLDCLDSSWVLSLNWAIQKHLVFGRDYILTYGALGFLSTRNTFGLNPYYLLASDLFVIGNLIFILNYALRKFRNWQAVTLCFAIVYILASSAMYLEHIVFVLWLISIFWLHYFSKHQQTWNLIFPALIVCLLFYIKVNISFVSLGIFYGYLIYCFFTLKSHRITLACISFSVPFFIFLLSFPLQTDIPGYVVGGLSLVDGYNDAMNLNIKKYVIFLIFALTLSIILFTSLWFKGFKRNFPLLAAGTLFSYVLYKQSFVRLDLHIIGFFAIFPAICGVITIFYENLTKLQVWLIAGICIFCLSVGLWLNIYPSILSRTNYISEVFSPNNLQERYENSFARFEFSPEVKTVIGDKSVDIIPWNIESLYFNNFNYNPRPVVQSYTAYTPYLSAINGQKYRSPTAPEIVIVSNKSIDERYAFFDDTDAKIALIENYKLLGLYDSLDSKFLIFQKKHIPTVLEHSAETVEIIELGKDYLLKNPEKAYFFKIDIEYNLFGKAIRLAYKPFPIVIVFTLEDDSERRFKAIPPILENGVLINPLIETEEDLYNFYNNVSLADGKKIKSFRIELNSPKAVINQLAASSYNHKIKISASEISIKEPNR